MNDLYNTKNIFKYIPEFSVEWHVFLIENAQAISNMVPIGWDIPAGTLKLFPVIQYILRNFNNANWNACLDDIDGHTITGWAKRKNSMNSQFLSLSINGSIAYQGFLANSPRPDVKEAGYGTGLYGFSLSAYEFIDNKLINFAWITESNTNTVIAFRFYKNPDE